LLYANQSFVNPRATFFVDTKLGEQFYSLVQARLDRGFDAADDSFDARMDEYLLRWTPAGDRRLNVQFGKFATVVGTWVQRHDTWQNPLITAPLPYENLTTVSYTDVPSSPSDFLARRKHPDDKDSYLPIIWGPAYTTGWALFGTIGKADYAVEIKNTANSSHPSEWTVSDTWWKYPTVSGRFGFRPAVGWNSGFSFSAGPYLNYDAEDNLPAGKTLSDYNQVTLGYDLSYERGHWQFWSEVFASRYEVPNVGNADTLAYYIEAKYKITTALYAAARWNQQFYGKVPDGTGGEQTWDNDMLRVDLALGYRFSRHLQTKLQYSFGHRDGDLQQGEQLVAAQVTLRF
jgi:hypothetical protein